MDANYTPQTREELDMQYPPIKEEEVILEVLNDDDATTDEKLAAYEAIDGLPTV